MKREKRILKMVWEDLWVGLGLVLVLCAAQFIRSSQWNLERLRELAAFSFPDSLIMGNIHNKEGRTFAGAVRIVKECLILRRYIPFAL